MKDWTSYALQDFIPFTADIYFRLLERMGEIFWPLHILTLLMGAGALWLALYKRTLFACLLFAPLWLWVAYAFFIQRYAELNWAGEYVGYLFVVQTLLLLLLAFTGFGRDSKLSRKGTDVIAILITLTGFVGMPLIAPLSGVSWYQSQVFGIHPDPTAISTIGLALMMFRGWILWLIFIIPALWLLLSGLTLWVLGSSTAIILFIVLILALIGLVWKPVEDKFV